MAQRTRFFPSMPVNDTRLPSSWARGSGNVNARVSSMPSTPRMPSTDDSWMSFSPFSKRETVGVLTPASVASRSCVSFCAFRRCRASSI